MAGARQRQGDGDLPLTDRDGFSLCVPGGVAGCRTVCNMCIVLVANIGSFMVLRLIYYGTNIFVQWDAVARRKVQ